MKLVKHTRLILLPGVFALVFFLVACGTGGWAPLEPDEDLSVYAPKIETARGVLQLDLVPFASGFTSPVSIANAGDSRLFIVEQRGVIKILQSDGSTLATPFLDIQDRVDSSSDEEGLLGLTFHPDYTSNGYFYVNYTNTTGQRRTRISRFSVTGNPNVADPNSEEILLTVVQPYSNHNAGDIHFGPDGYLYIPLGDGGSGGDPDNNGQILTNILGDISRIDVDSGPGSAPDCVGDGTGNYTIPADNPYVDGSGTGLCDEIWASGVRNPWRSSFDRLTGDFYIADVGQSNWEELNFQPASSTGGENYGWRCYEGNHPYNTTGCEPIGDYDFPVYEYSHSFGCSIVGGYVYRGSQYPNMYGRYFFTDYCSGNLWDIDPNGWVATRHTNVAAFGYVSFGEATDGELYVSQRNGNIYRLVEELQLTPTPTSTSAVTPTATASATATGTNTPTATSTGTATSTSTATATTVGFGTATFTPTASLTPTSTTTPGATNTATTTATATATAGATATATATSTPSPTPSATPAFEPAHFLFLALVFNGAGSR